MFNGHPKGLPALFFTEMWERFGFYLMLGIFFLYMTDTQTGGLGLSRANAADIYGTYIALVYLTPFLGGLLADRYLGYRKSIIIGGTLMGLGYLGLALPGMLAFYISLLLIILGNGFFKPNISTLLGNLYSKPEFKSNKDAGYNIFYMGINIGAFFCNFVAAYLRNSFGWGWAFAAAGIGMFIGVAWFLFGQKYTLEADVKKPMTKEDMPLMKIISYVFLPAAVAAAIGWFIPGNLLGSDSTDAFILACIPVAVFYFSLWYRASSEDKQPIAALLSIFAVVIIFWAIFHQNGSALTVWAESYTDRKVPAAVEKVADLIGVDEQVDTSMREVPHYDSHGKPMLDEQGKPIMTMGPHPYFNNIPQDQRPSENTPWTLVSTEIFQSINPFFVVILTPLVVGFFAFMRRRNKEPSTAGKIGLGLVITALSTVIMMCAVMASQNGLVKSSPLWLIVTYGVITVGELCLSPMGLSLVSKLSPPRITALMMGGWMLSTAIGNKLSGLLSGLWDMYDNKIFFFLINFIGAAFAALMIFMMIKWLNKVIDKNAH